LNAKARTYRVIAAAVQDQLRSITSPTLPVSTALLDTAATSNASQVASSDSYWPHTCHSGPVALAELSQSIAERSLCTV